MRRLVFSILIAMTPLTIFSADACHGDESILVISVISVDADPRVLEVISIRFKDDSTANFIQTEHIDATTPTRTSEDKISILDTEIKFDDIAQALSKSQASNAVAKNTESLTLSFTYSSSKLVTGWLGFGTPIRGDGTSFDSSSDMSRQLQEFLNMLPLRWGSLGRLALNSSDPRGAGGPHVLAPNKDSNEKKHVLDWKALGEG